MNKKFALSVIIVIQCLTGVFALTAKAQEIIGEAVLELPVRKGDKVSVDRLQLNADGSFTLFAFAQWQLSAQEYLPGFYIYKLDSILQLQEHKKLTYAPARTVVKEKNLLSGHKAGVREAEIIQHLKSTFPELYPATREADNFYEAAQFYKGKPIIRQTSQLYTYDSLSHSFLTSSREALFGLELGLLEASKLHIYDELKFNSKEGLLSMVAGQKEGQDQRAIDGQFLKQTLVLSKLKGPVLGMHEISFASPMEIRLQQFVYDQENNCRGVAYIFGPARKFGKRTTEPDSTSYQIVVLNEQGEKVLHHSFRYGTRDSASEPFYAASIGENFYILGKGVGRVPDYHLLIFDKEGMKKQTLISPDELFQKTLGPYKLGLQKEYASNFMPAGVRQLPSGGVVFFGEHRITEAMATYDLQTNSPIPARYRYGSYTFLQFDAEGNLTRQFVLPKQREEMQGKAARMELLSASNQSMKLLVYELCSGKAILKDYQVFYTAHENRSSYKNYQQEAEVPLVLKISLEDKKTGELRFPDDFVSLGQEGFAIHNPEKEELLIAGKQLNQEGPLKVILKKIKL